MKRLADFIRDARSRNMRMELIEWYGKTGNDIPERLRGIRRVIRQNTLAVFLETPHGTESELRWGAASLNEYDEKSFIIYTPGLRPLTTKEKEILEKWYDIEKEYLSANPFAETFWKRKDYFKHCECPWLYGNDTVKGQKLEYVNSVPMIRTNAIKGTPILKYKVYLDDPVIQLPKFVVCINSGVIRDAQMFETEGLDDKEIDELDYFDCEQEARWYDRDVTPYVGMTEADNENSACTIIGEALHIDPRVLFAIRV